jgi:hypothetical protein
MPESLAESFWGWARAGQSQVPPPSPVTSPGLLPHQTLYMILTSVFQKDRKGMRELEGLASENRGCRSLRVWSLG